MKKLSLRGKIAVISGGSSGMGAAIAKKFLQEGAKTFIADIREPDIRVKKKNFHFCHCDTTKAEQVEDFVQTVFRSGIPDILVLSAGRGIHDKLTEGDPEQWKYILELNILGHLRLIRAFTPAMIERKSGDVVFISSVAAKTAYPYGGIYSATKAAMEMILETLRLEVQPSLRVTTITPGVVNTPFFSNVINGSETPETMGWGAISPEDIASTLFQAISLPKMVSVNNITIRPTAQPL